MVTTEQNFQIMSTVVGTATIFFCVQAYIQTIIQGGRPGVYTFNCSGQGSGKGAGSVKIILPILTILFVSLTSSVLIRKKGVTREGIFRKMIVNFKLITF